MMSGPPCWPFSLRWILLHMVEETARHNGYAGRPQKGRAGSSVGVRSSVLRVLVPGPWVVQVGGGGLSRGRRRYGHLPWTTAPGR
ncbi:MAG: DUF664 domain-containing protein [Euzebya sp.]